MVNNKIERDLYPNEMYKKYCKELGGYVNVLYEENKLLLNDVELDEGNKFRLLYLSRYLGYEEKYGNLLVKDRVGKDGVKHLTKRDLKNILNISKETFNDFLFKCKNLNLILEEEGKFYISDKYFYKGNERFGKTYLKLFINPLRKLYNSSTSRGHKIIFNMYRLIPYENKEHKIEINKIRNEIDISNLARFIKSIDEISNEKFISRDNKYLILSEKLGSKYNILSNEGIELPKLSYSEGENKIAKFLRDNNIKFYEEYSFPNLFGTGGGLLRYDFYLPKYNLIIEFNGLQHREFIQYFHKTHEEFERLKEHDKRKRIYALEHNIDLLDIWYYNEDNIEYILKNHLKLN